MKIKFTRFYPLSLVLATIPIQFANAQDAEKPPVEVVEDEAEKAAKRNARLDRADGQKESKKDRQNRRAENDESTSKEGMTEEEEAEAAKDKNEQKGNDEEAAEMPVEPKMKQEEAKSEEKSDKPKAKESEKKDAPEMDEKNELAPAAEAESKPVPDAPAAVTEEEVKEAKEAAAEAESNPEPKPVPDAPAAVVETKEEVEEAEEADLTVDRTTRLVEEKADERKMNIKDEAQARDLIRDLIGKDSEVSKAEAERERRLETRVRSNDRRGRDGGNRDEMRGASDFLLRQLSGNARDEEAPAFFRRPAGADSYRDGRREGRDRTFYEAAPPRYFHEGRRYVRFNSRNSIPAILLAAAALDRVTVQPANRIDRFFPADGGRNDYANALPPENYRGDEAVVVSYPVSTGSMISSNDIIFAQGSTRFADGHSYDMVLALAEAMANPAIKDARFIIEGHASAEGSYEENMELSQRRAEAIVRDMVREGIDPERLIPVGYGESEARYAADSAESLRARDRNVRVFRAEQ